MTLEIEDQGMHHHWRTVYMPRDKQDFAECIYCGARTLYERLAFSPCPREKRDTVWVNQDGSLTEPSRERRRPYEPGRMG